LEYSIDHVDNLTCKLKLTLPSSDVQSEIDESYKTLRKQVSIPGFRKGKVPLDLIKARYGKEVENEVFDDIINKKFQEIMKSETYQVIGGGVVKNIDWQPKESLHATIEFQIAPQVELKKIDELNVIKEIREVTDEDFENTISRLREQHAVVKPVEEGAQNGHFIVADFQEVDESGMPIIGKKLADRNFRLGSGLFGKKFDEQLVGIKNGEERSVEVVFQPKPGEEKKEFYKINVKKIEEQILPELDDEFSKSVGEYEDVNGLKDSIREQLKNQLERQSEDKLHNNLIDELIKSNPFDIPPIMVDHYLNAWFEDIKKESKQELNEQELKERNRPFAIRNLKWHMLKDELIKQENISFGDTEIEKSFQDIADNAKVDVSEIKKYYQNKKNRDDLVHQLEDKQVFDRLLKTAKIEEVKVADKKSDIIQ